jgi:hypothetical protein
LTSSPGEGSCFVLQLPGAGGSRRNAAPTLGGALVPPPGLHYSEAGRG